MASLTPPAAPLSSDVAAPPVRGRRGVRALACGSAFLAALGALLLVQAQAALRLEPPPWVGNRASTVARLPPIPDGAGFSFAVIGDPEDGLPRFRELLRRIRKTESAFLLIAGDAVKSPQIHRYGYFLNSLADAGGELPVFCAPGNSDVAATPGPGPFDLVFGARSFDFEYGDCLFSLLDNARGDVDAAQIERLERRLAARPGGYRHVFVVLHKPLLDPEHLTDPVLAKAGARPERELRALLARWRVDGVLAAHLHGYLRYMVGGIPVIVTGGGGAPIQQEGVPYHALEFSVAPGAGGVTDRMIALEPEGAAARAAYGLSKSRIKVVGVVSRYPAMSVAVELLLIAAAAAAWRRGKQGQLPFSGAVARYRTCTPTAPRS